jgi:hypothetical protein
MDRLRHGLHNGAPGARRWFRFEMASRTARPSALSQGPCHGLGRAASIRPGEAGSTLEGGSKGSSRFCPRRSPKNGSLPLPQAVDVGTGLKNIPVALDRLK